MDYKAYTKPEYYWNREISWLGFNERVLSEARDKSIPLFERLKFLLENAESEVTIVSNLKVGDAVRVVSGPLRGLEGVISEADEKGSIVGIQIDGLGYACVKIDKRYLNIK